MIPTRFSVHFSFFPTDTVNIMAQKITKKKAKSLFLLIDSDEFTCINMVQLPVIRRHKNSLLLDYCTFKLKFGTERKARNSIRSSGYYPAV